jgi:hypothetical protein
MRFIKRSERSKPEVSLVLLDWSVRESFHLLYYLSQQTTPRDSFEVIIIEYHSRVSEGIREFESEVDSWIVLDMPETCYYHKHLMYNVGIAAANGNIVMIGDSDAMVKESFIESINTHFRNEPNSVYHIDQFRNSRREFYPFNYPSFEEVLGDGCVNIEDGKTSGVLNTTDPIHHRNYGACMCAHRSDLIEIGGADMHIDFLGHICGPYDMTFRLMNKGRREVWDMEEFMYHTWHPGQAGADNYLGPHDGRHMSTTALEALSSGRKMPIVESEGIRLLRTDKTASLEDALELMIDERFKRDWDIELLKTADSNHEQWSEYKRVMGVYKGYRLIAEVDRVFAYPLTDRKSLESGQGSKAALDASNIEEAKRRIDAATPSVLSTICNLSSPYLTFFRLTRAASGVVGRRLRPQVKPSYAILALLVLALPVALVLMIVKPRAMRAKIRSAKLEAGQISNSIGNIAIVLLAIGRDTSQEHSPVVLLESRHEIYFLRFLRLLRIIPPFEGRRILELSDAVATVDALSSETNRPVIISSALNSRFVSAFSGETNNDSFVVV